jgi:hypothetical protein
MMDKTEIEKRIVKLTNKLRNEKPTVYKHLTENPQTLPEKDSNEESLINDLKKYEEHLKNLLSS